MSSKQLLDGLIDKMEDEKKDDAKKKEIKIPFKKIEDEAYLIKEGDKEASMCVTSCNGELNPPFISAKGINYLKKNFNSNELDIFVDTYAKCGTTVGIKMVYKILEVECMDHLFLFLYLTSFLCTCMF